MEEEFVNNDTMEEVKEEKEGKEDRNHQSCR